MNDDLDFERLRNDARSLRFEGDPFFPARLRARVLSRISAGATIPEILFRWRRRIAVALLAVTMAATTGVVASTPQLTTDSIGSEADAGLMGEDFYSAAN
jgi:hypothetical protein